MNAHPFHPGNLPRPKSAAEILQFCTRPNAGPIVHIMYNGSNHYDALVPPVLLLAPQNAISMAPARP